MKGGLNLSHDKFQNYNNGVLLDLVSEADQYFHIGGLIEFMIPDKKTQFQLEVLYTGGGTIIQESEISNRIEINVNQLALPLIVKFEVTEDWSFISGSYLGYILNAKEKNRWVLQLISKMIFNYLILDSYLVLNSESITAYFLM